jgi:hypothetical protein
LRVRQFWTEEKWLRVTDDQELNGYRFVAINQQMSRADRLRELMEKGAPLPKALSEAAGDLAPVVMHQVQQQHQAMAAQAQAMGVQPPPADPAHMLEMISTNPLMQEMMTINQVDQLDVDILIDEAPDTAVIEQEEFENITAVLQPVVQLRPDMAPLMVELLIQASSLRDKQKILEKLRADKNADPQAQQQQQMQQQMQQLTMQIEQLKAALTQAETAKAAAETEKIRVETQLLVPEAQADDAAKQSGALHDQALAMKHATDAGVKAGSGGMTSGA